MLLLPQARRARRTIAVTGFLAEMFGAVQALKVAGSAAERHAVRHFERLNDERRRTAIRAQMLEEFVVLDPQHRRQS